MSSEILLSRFPASRLENSPVERPAAELAIHTTNHLDDPEVILHRWQLSSPVVLPGLHWLLISALARQHRQTWRREKKRRSGTPATFKTSVRNLLRESARNRDVLALIVSTAQEQSENLRQLLSERGEFVALQTVKI